MGSKVVTVSEMIRLVLVDEPNGLNFDTLLSRCNYIGHQVAFETNLRSLVRQAKVFTWKGKFHHSKYRGEPIKAKKRKAKETTARTKKTLTESVKKVNRNLDMKIKVLDNLIEIVRKDQRLVLIQIKANLEFVANAGL